MLTHACCSSLSGLAAAVVSNPADVIKTRIMDQLTRDTITWFEICILYIYIYIYVSLHFEIY